MWDSCGGASIDEAWGLTTCDDDDVRAAVKGMKAYREARDREALAASAFAAAEKTMEDRLDAVRLAIDAAKACEDDLPADAVAAFVEASEAAFVGLSADLGARVAAAKAEHAAATARAAALRGVVVEGAREVLVDLRGDASPDVPDFATCPVCMDRAVGACYAACGHTACGPCAAKTVRGGGWSLAGACPMCRRESRVVDLRFAVADPPT